MPDFWQHSGYHLLEHGNDHYLVITDDLLRAWLARPEVAPIETSCEYERQLFARLMEEPRLSTDKINLKEIADSDTRDNYRIALAWRDYLLEHQYLEDAYRNLFIDDKGKPKDFAGTGFPPIFADQLAHIIIRSLIDGTEDGLLARVAELWFREQRVSIQDGYVMLADSETLANKQQGGQYGDIGRLLAETGISSATATLDVLDTHNHELYWQRDERHDLAINLAGVNAKTQNALAQLISLWVSHFWRIAPPTVRPVRAVERAHWGWFIGLDKNSSQILNRMYAKQTISSTQQKQLLLLLEMDLPDSPQVLSVARQSPVILAVATDESGQLILKPQNLLTNFPLPTR